MNRNSQHWFVRGLSMVGLNVIVLAAGRSSRLGQPKAFVEVGGRPLIVHLVHRLQNLPGIQITVVTNDDLLADVLLACPSVHAVLNPNPEHGVVDLNGKVHGLENVYIVDASTFPRCSGVNPMISIQSMSHFLMSKI